MRPRGEHKLLSNPAFVEPAVRVRHHQHNRKRGVREVRGVRTARRELTQSCAITDDDQLPGLRVLGRAGPAGNLQYVVQDVVGDRAGRIAPHRARAAQEAREL